MKKPFNRNIRKIDFCICQEDSFSCFICENNCLFPMTDEIFFIRQEFTQGRTLLEWAKKK